MKTITITTTLLIAILACLPVTAQEPPAASRGGLADLHNQCSIRCPNRNDDT